MPKKTNLEYDEESIKVLKGLEAVRKKPTLYIGPTDDYGIFTILREPSDNVLDEFEAGRASNLAIQIFKNGRIAIHDDGQGMPVGMHKTEKLPTLQVLVSLLHAGGKLEKNDAYKNSRGTHGIGIKATNALSKYFRVYTYRDKKWWTISYEKGVLKTEFSEVTPKEVAKEIQPVFKRGTIVIFEPDLTVFDKGAKLNIDMVREWAENTAYLAAGFNIMLLVEGNPIEEFQFENGIVDWLAAEIEERECGELTKKPFELRTDNLDMIMTFTDTDGCLLMAHCNGLYQSEGGNHLNTTLSAIFASLKPYAGARDTITRDDVAEGILGIVNFKVDSPKFSSQDKIKLTDSRFEEFCKAEIEAALEAYWNKNKGIARDIVKRASNLRGAKEQFALNKKAITELKKRQGDLGRLPNKMAICRDCKPEDRELFLIEGDSAGGTAKGARMTKPFRYQETLALKGKPLNAYKCKDDRLLGSEEVLNILTAIGFDPTAKDPMSKLRVGKIIMLSDPDPDGYHINCLILALLAKVIPGVFSRGMVYAVVSPKYLLTADSQQFFAMTLEELRDKLPKGVDISRASYLKGWGEAGATAMREIAFNPEARQLIQINKPDKKELAEFERLMGEDSEYTREMLGIG